MALKRKSKQFRWQRKHLLGLRDLSDEEITHILDTAKGFEQVSTRSVKKAPPLRMFTLMQQLLSIRTTMLYSSWQERVLTLVLHTGKLER